MKIDKSPLDKALDRIKCLEREINECITVGNVLIAAGFYDSSDRGIAEDIVRSAQGKSRE